MRLLGLAITVLLLGQSLLTASAQTTVSNPLGGQSPQAPAPGSAAAAPAPGGPEQAVNTIVARHTIIPVLITKDIRVGGAGDAKEERKIKLAVAQDVIIDGFIIAKEGDLVEAHFTTEKNVTKRIFSTDTSQEVSLDVDDVVNYCGDTIHMQFERTFVGGVRGGFLSLGAHAHDAVFDKGVVLKAESDRVEKSVCATRTTRTPPILPPNMLVPDEEVSPAPH